MTRVSLLTVFAVGLVAQFVKPVGDALEGKAYIGGALLSLVGYALYSEVQRLNSAHELQRQATERMAAAVDSLQRQNPAADLRFDPDGIAAELRDVLWSGARVELATMAFTAENFVHPLKRMLGGLPVDSRREVNVRVLVPDFTQPVSVPGRVRADGTLEDSPGFRARLLAKVSEYAGDLGEMRSRMRSNHQGTLTVEFRVLHHTPEAKLYLLNDEQAIHGTYDKFELRPNEYDEGEGRLFDLIGNRMPMIRWHRDAGTLAREMVIGYRTMFDTYWELARPLTVQSPSSNGRVPATRRQEG
ncbi:ATP/GTP-binding protein [Streptomyces sp. NPDC017615]|uniref:ATP/GTP-binding protein n=1 Tax=Streptomyces sp. NPDC017615 TaxID=3365003 RepID=UPI003797E61B